MIFAAPHDPDLFDAVLADVADPKLSGQRIKAEPPRLAKAIGPNLRAGVCPAAERIIGRDGVGQRSVAMVDVQAQHFAKEEPEVLPVTLWILLGTGVAHAKVEIAIRAELNAAAAVVLCHAHDLEQTA